MERLINRDKLWELFVKHYWDSLQKDRDVILCHVDAVMRMIPNSQELVDPPVEYPEQAKSSAGFGSGDGNWR